VSKPKTTDVIMVKVDNDGRYQAIDAEAVKVLGGREAFTVAIPVQGRSNNQNATWAMFYNIISKHRGDMTAPEVKRECKLRYGVPILRAENEAFRAFYDAGLKMLKYEQKLEAMEFVPVTSIMSKSQGMVYTETLQREYAAQGIVLDVL
jgi:hypothetical protein